MSDKNDNWKMDEIASCNQERLLLLDKIEKLKASAVCPNCNRDARIELHCDICDNNKHKCDPEYLAYEDDKDVMGEYAMDFNTWVIENLVILSSDSFHFPDDEDFVFDVKKAHTLFLENKC